MQELFSYLDPHTPASEVYGRITTQESCADVTALHTHNFCEFTLVTKGSIFHIINDYTYRIQEGMLIFVRAADKHFYRKITNSDLVFYNIGIPNDILNIALRYYNIEKKMLFSLLRVPDAFLSPNDYIMLKNKIIKFMETPYGIEHGQLFLSIVSDVIFHIITAVNNSSDNTPVHTAPPWFSKILLKMEEPENYIEGIKKLRTLSSYSIEHISRCFKKYLNCTPTQYINRLRIDHAALMLKNSDCSILDACFSSGFNNEGYFYKQFKKYYSMTPMEFAILHRKELKTSENLKKDKDEN